MTSPDVEQFRVMIYGHRGTVTVPARHVESCAWIQSYVGPFSVQAMKNYAGYHVYVDRGYAIHADAKKAFARARRWMAFALLEAARTSAHQLAKFESKKKHSPAPPLAFDTWYDHNRDRLDWHGHSDELIMREAYIMGAVLTEFFGLLGRWHAARLHTQPRRLRRHRPL